MNISFLNFLNNVLNKLGILSEPEHIGTFMNRPIPEQKAPEPEEPDTERLKKLATLMSERSHTGREGKDQSI